jgi:hypothetical protein
MGMNQFASARMPPEKWVLSDSLARVPASGVPAGKILERNLDPIRRGGLLWEDQSEVTFSVVR